MSRKVSVRMGRMRGDTTWWNATFMLSDSSSVDLLSKLVRKEVRASKTIDASLSKGKRLRRDDELALRSISLEDCDVSSVRTICLAMIRSTYSLAMSRLFISMRNATILSSGGRAP